MLLKPTPPFDFDLTVGYQASFQSYYGDSLLRDGTYRQLLEFNGKLLLVSARSTGTVERPELEVDVLGEDVSRKDVLSASEKLASMLGMSTELREYYAFAQGDPDMAFITRELYGLHIPRTGSIFEALVMAITSQQIAFNVASLIRNLLVRTYGAASPWRATPTILSRLLSPCCLQGLAACDGSSLAPERRNTYFR